MNIGGKTCSDHAFLSPFRSRDMLPFFRLHMNEYWREDMFRSCFSVAFQKGRHAAGSPGR